MGRRTVWGTAEMGAWETRGDLNQAGSGGATSCPLSQAWLVLAAALT